MRFPVHVGLAIGSLVLVANACQSDPSTAPGLTRGVAGASSRVLLSCDFTALRQAASAFFASPGDPVFPIIDDIELLWRPGGAPAADTKIFDGFARLAAVRGTDDQAGTGADAEQVIKGFMGCSSSTAVPMDVDSLDSAIDNGAFEVRGGPLDAADPVLAYAAGPGYRTPANPMWGAQAGSWSATLGGRTLLFGYERPVSDFTTEPPVLNQGVPFTGFELSSFPSGLTFPASSQLTAGICVDPFVYGFSRLLHNTPGSQILPLASLSFCAGNGASQPSPGGVLALGGVGGSLSGLSPSGAVLVTPSNDQIVVAQEPNDAIVRQPISVVFRAQTDLATPVGGVFVTVTIHPGGRTVSGYTQSDGTLTVSNIRIPVAGFYTLTATGTLGEQPLQSAMTRRFWIRA
ncbi:MAG: hypothetical protein MNPFHGCM_03241 [Gemmatimonadaceae bacterium]|nr:hypothetical protein [Gemmatimonadaceae bacterium]